MKDLPSACRASLMVAVCLWAVAAVGQGYSIRGNQLSVDQRRHWETWAFSAGTVEISPTGSVQAHFVPKDINAAADTDILEHLRRNPPGTKTAETVRITDALEAGTNVATVVNVIDGLAADDYDYWEPAADRPLQDWWFQVDLGRVVSAKRIVLRFVPEGEGDPFLQFAVLTSDGDVTSAGDVEYNTVFRTIRDTKDQRLFEIELTPTRPNQDVEFTNDMIRLVQVVVTESDTTRAAEVTESDYAELDADDRGAVDYHKKVADGRVRVSQATYDAIDPGGRGSIRYYRRERPRLAQIEVWTEGENISLGLKERKGVAIDFRGNSAVGTVDGAFETFVNMQSTQDSSPRTLFFDLNAFYWLDTHHTYYSRERRRWGNYDLQTSDGSRAPDGSLMWKIVSSVRNRSVANGTANYDADLFDPVKARFVQFSFWAPPNASHEAVSREIQFYGEGYQPEVELTSPLIRLGSEQNLVSIDWDALTPEGTVLEIQTRTGNDLNDDYRYYDLGGVEVADLEAYEALGFFRKGRIDTLEVAGGDWSSWSSPYAQSGAPIVSPSPRQFIMLRARLLSSDPNQAAVLNSLAVNFAAPLARQLLGELEPGTVAALGEDEDLSLFIRPVSQRSAFDEILLRAPSGMALSFRQLRLGQEADWVDGQIDAVAGVQVIPTGADSLWLRLDAPLEPQVAELIEVQFSTALYIPGAQFLAAIGESAKENSWQRVDAPNAQQDATELASSQSLVLRGPAEGRRVLSAVEVVPAVVTPNGDGINDHVDILFKVSSLTGSKDVDLRIWDLSGRLVNAWSERRPNVSGAYTVEWKGEAVSGQVLPPGIYILEISVDVDSGSGAGTATRRVLQVAY
jgi:hypothetical protein